SSAADFAASSHNHAASEVTSGTLLHERGGLEADLSAYSGLVKISGGATSQITDNSSNWDTAYGWGDHSGAGYLTSETGDISAVGSMTAAGAAFADATATGDWLGLGAAAGRIEFDDQATDEVNILNAFVGIGTTAPGGTLDVNGTIYQRGGELHADYVFEPEYELESIEEHSEYMWANKHLKAVPPAQIDEAGQQALEIGAHRKGMLEELEKAHVYIQQLNDRINALELQMSTMHLSKLEKD
ncbi:MAG: hypothetical protein ABIG56_03080, partial [Candidatus Omnitrophota bacterium]